MKRLALLTVSLGLLLPSSAQAVYQGPFTEDLAIAASYWGATSGPCAPEHINIVFADIQDTGSGEEAAHAPLSGCLHRYGKRVLNRKRLNRNLLTITIDVAEFNRVDVPRSWWCTAIAHEYGHLLGHSHSADPLSPMAAPPIVGSVPGCVGI